MTTEMLNILLAWMGEHWLLTFFALMFLSRWRPLTVVDARSDTNVKAKLKNGDDRE